MGLAVTPVDTEALDTGGRISTQATGMGVFAFEDREFAGPISPTEAGA